MVLGSGAGFLVTIATIRRWAGKKTLYWMGSPVGDSGRLRRSDDMTPVGSQFREIRQQVPARAEPFVPQTEMETQARQGAGESPGDRA